MTADAIDPDVQHGALRAALRAIADRARNSPAERREDCLEEIEALANLALHDSRQTDDPEV